jgi:hypothetical protein
MGIYCSILNGGERIIAKGDKRKIFKIRSLATISQTLPLAIKI